MADYSMYHALGQGEQIDPNDPNRTTQPAPPQFNPPVAQQPYQQASPYGSSPAPTVAPRPDSSNSTAAGRLVNPYNNSPMAMARPLKPELAHPVQMMGSPPRWEAPAAPGSAFGAVPSPGAPSGFFSPPDAGAGAGPQLLSPSQGFTPAMSPGLSPGLGPQGSQFPPSANPAFAPGPTSPLALGCLLRKPPRCRAYINPFMMFRNGGNKFVCNLCSYPNDTPSEYFCATTPAGVRVDRDQRPELTRGTVEFVVPKEYWTREPVGLRWLFLIDVTQESFNKGFLEAFARASWRLSTAAKTTRRVGFVTFDKDIHFYNVKPGLEQAQMMIMPDIEDPFDVITALLNRLPMIFSTIKNAEPALLPALNAAFAGLEATGGKIICSAAALPHGIDKKLLTTEHPLWTKLGERMAAAGVGADFFLASPSGGYLDVATIGHVSSSTGGETFYYPNFIGGRDNAKLSSEIKHAVTRETGYQALMKVRCSTGLQVAEYYGNFIQHSFGADLEIGVLDADKAIGIKFSYDGKLDAKLDAHFQSALLYTTADGQRRVRCSNVIASVSENTRDCLKFVDQDAVYSMLAKEAVTKLAATSSNFRDVRNWISERTIEILSSHRKNFTSQSAPPGQLILPERLKEFAMYALCLVKCRAFKGGNETSDRRVQELRMIQSIGAQELSLYLYPRIVPIHNLEPADEPGGVYLVDNGQQCLVWFHAQTSPDLIADLFGPDFRSLQSLDAYTSSLPVLDTHLNAQVRNILEFFKVQRGSKAANIQLARQGIDGAEYEFARMLMEDRNNEAQSYVDWLVHVHKAIQLELNGSRKKEDKGDGGVSSFAGFRPNYW
ncbi:unnamed protein product [Parascedosporium putredinis]|uniref:Uncharacterized protein n=1 Tax=Parascedosporium putredinis TaxID=1442378 RepID=A0A9P1H7U9_9PEZI|nr:unnamed protein product [Parascedosporium putredinis]CAI8000060.1 unnamed protein product [Parascedosporium putredinis]